VIEMLSDLSSSNLTMKWTSRLRGRVFCTETSSSDGGHDLLKPLASPSIPGDNGQPSRPIVARDNVSTAPDAVWPLVARVRGAVLEAIATFAPHERSFIFTYAGADEDPADHNSFEEYRDVAKRRGARFVPVRLLCNENESVRRIQSPGRSGQKLVNPEEAISNVQSYTVLDPRMPNALTFDVTRLSADSRCAQHSGSHSKLIVNTTVRPRQTSIKKQRH
jgi:hypothetical protein